MARGASWPVLHRLPEDVLVRDGPDERLEDPALRGQHLLHLLQRAAVSRPGGPQLNVLVESVGEAGAGLGARGESPHEVLRTRETCRAARLQLRILHGRLYRERADDRALG